MSKLSDFSRISKAAEYLGVSPNPLRNWQNAGKLSVHRHLVYVQSFVDVFTGAGRTIKKTPIKSPNQQAFVERVIQTLKHEVLNGFCVVSEQHLDYILRIGADWYNRRRGHSGRDHLPPVRDEEDTPVVDLAKLKIVCHAEPGGHLKSCRGRALSAVTGLPSGNTQRSPTATEPPNSHRFGVATFLYRAVVPER